MCHHHFLLPFSLVKGVNLINTIPNKTFSILLKQTITSTGTKPLTQDELQQLENHLKLPSDDVHLLVQSLCYIWKQSLKVILEPSAMERDLTQVLGLEKSRAKELLQEWTTRLQEDCGDLEKRKKLEGVAWELNVETASSTSTAHSIPKARLQLELSDFVDGANKENVVLELDKEQLVKMYNMLENIQLKLDHMQKTSK